MSKSYPTEEETNRWLAGLPKKSIAVKVIVYSDKGNVLLVKPNYKKTWQFPGGGVEQLEDPLEAVLRELKEELQLVVNKDDFLLVGTAFRREHDNLFLVYEYQELLSEDTSLTLQVEELEGYKFEAFGRVGDHLSTYYDEFWNGYVAKNNNRLS